MATTERRDALIAEAADARREAIEEHRAAVNRIHSLAGDRRQAQRPELWETSLDSAVAKLEAKRTATSGNIIHDALVEVDRTAHDLHMARADYDHTVRS